MAETEPKQHEDGTGVADPTAVHLIPEAPAGPVTPELGLPDTDDVAERASEIGLPSGVARAMAALAQMNSNAEFLRRVRGPTAPLGPTWGMTSQRAAELSALSRSFHGTLDLIKNMEAAHRTLSAGPHASVVQMVHEMKTAHFLRSQQREHDLLAGALASTARLQAILGAMPQVPTPPLAATTLLKSLGELTSVTDQFYRDPAALATIKSIAETPAWLRVAPAFQLYTGTRAALAAADEIHDEAFATTADVEVEAVLAEIADDVEMRLASVDAAFVSPYRGAKHAIESRHADWNRHFAVSVRELLDHLIARLAPSNELGAWAPARPTAYFSQGEWTHRAQLHYIFRDVRTGPFAPMADKIIDVVLATFYPANSGVHELVPPHGEHQARVLWRHMQHCLSTILEAAGY